MVRNAVVLGKCQHAEGVANVVFAEHRQAELTIRNPAAGRLDRESHALVSHTKLGSLQIILRTQPKAHDRRVGLL